MVYVWKIALVALVALLTGCGPDTPAGPTRVVTPPATPPTPPPIEIDFPFDAPFWRALIYNSYDAPAGVESRVSRVFALDSIPNFYIRRSHFRDTAPGCGRRWSLADLDYMQNTIPDLVFTLTGHRYRGQVVVGCEDRERTGWITVVAATTEEEPDLAGYCGLARIGADPGRIWLNEDPNYQCTRRSLAELFSHEFGHAMGLFHVQQGFGHVMAKGEYTGHGYFTAKEFNCTAPGFLDTHLRYAA